MMYVRLLDTTAIKECDEGALVINTETGKNCYVNKTGLSFLRALDGTTQNTDTVISTLITQFDMISENELSHDFYEFFSEMKGKGIVVMSENIAERVKKIIVEHLGVEADKVQDNANFIDDLGADSLDTVELVMAFEEEFGCSIPDDAAEKIRTVKDVIDYIQKQV